MSMPSAVSVPSNARTGSFSIISLRAEGTGMPQGRSCPTLSGFPCRIALGCQISLFGSPFGLLRLRFALFDNRRVAAQELFGANHRLCLGCGSLWGFGLGVA